MKTKNLILIVALVSIATLTFSQNTAERESFTVKISLKCALQDPYLVRAMHAQIHPNFNIGDLESHYYSFAVRYRGNRYVITGTLAEWKRFFELDPIIPIPET
jgi:hypothetical protein